MCCRRLFFFILIFFSLSFILLYSSFQIKNISINEGLSQSQVSCIYQDSRGFIWIGTYDGLNRYDSYNFKSYKPERENQDSISHNRITSISEDDKGYLWIGTDGGGVNRFNPETGKFFSCRNNSETFQGLEDDTVNSIYKDKNNRVWVGTDSELILYDFKKKAFVNYLKKFKNQIGKEIYINTIIMDKNDYLWVGTNNGLLKFDVKKNKLISTYSKDFINNRITVLMEDNYGFWVGTTRGLYMLDKNRNKFVSYKNNLFNESHITGIIQRCTCSDRMVVSTRYRGIYIIDRYNGRIISYTNDSGNKNKLSINSILTIFEDRGGNLWLGTSGRGLDIISRISDNFIHYKQNGNIDKGLSNSFVYAIREDSDENLWIGTNGGGLNKLDRFTEKYTYFRSIDGVPNSLSGNNVISLHIDNDNIIWIGTKHNGLNRFNPGTGNFKIFKHDPDDPESLSNNHVKVIYEDSEDFLWIGTRGGGINRFDKEAETFKRYVEELESEYVFSIAEDNDYLWVGSDGLNRYDKKSGKFENYSKFIKEKNKNSTTFAVMSIFISEDKILWLGTYGKGLIKFNPKTKKAKYYGIEEGLPNSVVYGILPDNEGNLWMSTNRGLSKFDPDRQVFYNYTPEDGLQAFEFNGGAYYKGRNGQMYFGGINGFNSFFPCKVIIPNIAFTGLQIDKNRIDLSSESSYLEFVDKEKYLILPNNINDFIIRFSLLDYGNNKKKQYSYILKKIGRKEKKEWVPLFNKNFHKFEDITPGKYILKIKGANSSGIWNKKGIKMFIILKSKFRQNLIMGICVLIFLSLFLYYIFIFRKKTKLKKSEDTSAKNLQEFYKKYDITDREQEVINLLIRGKSYKQIKKELYISLSTVRNHIHNIYTKIGINSRHKLVELINSKRKQ